MENGKWLDYHKVDIKNGFWARRQKINRETTIWAVKEQYQKSHRFEALKCSRKKWQFHKPKPHIYWDSDVAKWIEAAAYILKKNKDKELEAFVDCLIDDIAASQLENGYFNSYFKVLAQKQIFKNVDNHELYCAGHLIEASVAYFEATNKRKFLDCMIKYADLIYEIFYIKNSAGFSVCGHAEIELALIRLYELTKDKKYLALSKCFVDRKGTEEGKRGLPKVKDKDLPFGLLEYSQNHLPLSLQTTAEGHAVRALYIYCAAADIALHYNDQPLFMAMDKIFDNIVNCRSYITGGVGSKYKTEAFGADFELLNDVAYNESCAAIAVMFFAKRLFCLKHDSKYMDMLEKVLYNGFLSSIDLTGESFFYTNPLEINLRKRKKGEWYPIPNRQKNFSCSCCPPNITRLIASLSGYIYMINNDTLFINQFIDCEAYFDEGRASLMTSYPMSSRIDIDISGLNKIRYLAVRIPNWCEKYTVNADIVKKESGYIFMKPENGEARISLDLEMSLKANFTDERVISNKGKLAFSYGPIVYCGEEIDNGDMDLIAVDKNPEYEIAPSDSYNAYTLTLKAKKQDKPFELKLIPYFAFNNRGESGMKVFFDLQ